MPCEQPYPRTVTVRIQSRKVRTVKTDTSGTRTETRWMGRTLPGVSAEPDVRTIEVRSRPTACVSPSATGISAFGNRSKLTTRFHLHAPCRVFCFSALSSKVPRIDRQSPKSRRANTVPIKDEKPRDVPVGRH